MMKNAVMVADCRFAGSGRCRGFLLSAAAAIALIGAGSPAAFAQDAPPQPAAVVAPAEPVLSGGDSGSNDAAQAAPQPQAEMPPPPIGEPVAVEPAATVPPPDAAVLEKVAEPAVTAPVPEAVTGGSSASSVSAEGVKLEAPDVYYDSRLNVPSGPLADTVGPRKVDPTIEPASKLVIAKKDASATDMEAQIVAANRALDLGRFESALELFDGLYKRNDHDPRILMGRAIAQQKLGMDDQAILSYEQLLDIVPDNLEATINLSGLVQKKYPEVAMRRLIDLEAKYPGNAGIAAQMGMIYAAQGKNAEAINALGKAASLQPESASHLYNLAVVSDRMGSKQEAVHYYQRALEADAVYGNGRSVPRELIYDRLSRLRSN
ncbi:MAG: tetratricopeptide repeat protein [Micavibrio aeruginosavorus]|nr:tetratricopeptide repeat protein [Micavibrio aeruginosavorus]